MTMHDLSTYVSRSRPKLMQDRSVVRMKNLVSYFLIPYCTAITSKKTGLIPFKNLAHSINKMCWVTLPQSSPFKYAENAPTLIMARD